MTELLSLLVAFIAVIISIIQHRRNTRLQKKVFEYQIEKDQKNEIRKELNKTKLNTIELNEKEVYLNHLLNKFKYLDFTGLNAILQRPLPLQKIYVRLRIIRKNIEKRFEEEKNYNKKNLSTDSQKTFEVTIKSIINSKLKIQDPIKILILGNPGSGKTTLMKWVALQCAKDELNFFSKYLPVYIPLKDFGKYPNETYKKHSLLEICLNQIRKENLSGRFLKKSIGNEKLLFLLDGLDEVAQESIRREVIDWIQNQNILRSVMMITSRYSGLRPSKGLVFNSTVDVCEIQDFSIEDISLFLKNWYSNIEMAIINSDEEIDSANDLARRRYNDLIKIINDNLHKGLRDLAVNPLLLTIIAIVHRTRATLPRERHKLYEEAIKVMIELWNIANRKVDISFGVDNSISNLSLIAVHLMKNNIREVSKNELFKLLPDKVEGKSLNMFIYEMVLKSGLLYESEGKIGFLHLTFQEYLTARYFAESLNQNEIMEYVMNDYWFETLKLFVNIGNTKQFFEEALGKLNDGSITNTSLVIELTNEIGNEEDRNYYQKKVLNYIFKQLGSLGSSDAHKELAYKIYDSNSFRNMTSLIDKESWEKLIDKEINYVVRNIAILALLQIEDSDKHKVYSQLMEKIDSFIDRLDKNPLGQKKVNLENRFIVNCYLSFNILTMFSKDIKCFLFVLKLLKSKHESVRFLAILALKDYVEFHKASDALELFNYIILKDLDLTNQGEGDLFEGMIHSKRNKSKKNKQIKDLQTPKHLQAITDSNYEKSCLQIRSDISYSNLISEYHSNKEVLKRIDKDISIGQEKILNRISKLSEKEILKFFPGTRASNSK